MSYRFTNVLMFAVGAAIGSAVTWKILKDRYERIVQEEIESVREAFSDNFDAADEEETEAETGANHKQIDWSELEDLDEEEYSESDMREYSKLVSNYKNTKEGGSENMAKEPYVISPYDFGEIDGYNKIELTYYADGTLEDDEYNIVTDGDEILGVGSLYTFGEYEDDSVFVRNEKLRTDFQILRDYRTYAEARSIGPNKVNS